MVAGDTTACATPTQRTFPGYIRGTTLAPTDSAGL